MTSRPKRKSHHNLATAYESSKEDITEELLHSREFMCRVNDFMKELRKQDPSLGASDGFDIAWAMMAADESENLRLQKELESCPPPQTLQFSDDDDTSSIDEQPTRSSTFSKRQKLSFPHQSQERMATRSTPLAPTKKKKLRKLDDSPDLSAFYPARVPAWNLDSDPPGFIRQKPSSYERLFRKPTYERILQAPEWGSVCVISDDENDVSDLDLQRDSDLTSDPSSESDYPLALYSHPKKRELPSDIEFDLNVSSE